MRLGSACIVLIMTRLVPVLHHVSRQLGGGFDFASTALRVNFNDLQPDRVFPQERFYLVSNDGHLLLLSLGDDAGDGDLPPSSAQPPLAIEDLYHIHPPLQNGEIVSVCGCGEIVVMCRHSGSVTVLRRAPAPVCRTSVVGLIALSQHGLLASDQEPGDDVLRQAKASSGASKKIKLDDSAAQADDSSSHEPHHGEEEWTSAYYLLDARVGESVAERLFDDADECARVGAEAGIEGGCQLTLLVAVVSRAHKAGAEEPYGGGQTRCRLQRIHLERDLASDSWKTVSSVGVQVGAVVPPLARLWPSCDEILMVSSQTYAEVDLSDVGNPACNSKVHPAARASEYEEHEAGYDRLVHLHLPVRAGQGGQVDPSKGGGPRWKVRTYMLHDTASGPLTWIGPGGSDPSEYGLPSVGLGAKSGLGMHDLHVMRLAAVPVGAGRHGDGKGGDVLDFDSGPYTLESEHMLTFPAVGYIQKGKSNKKGVTFSCNTAVPSAFIVDAEDGVHAYEGNTRGVLIGETECSTSAGETGGASQGARRESSLATSRFQYDRSKFSSKARQTSIDLAEEGCGEAEQGKAGERLLGYQVVGR